VAAASVVPLPERSDAATSGGAGTLECTSSATASFVLTATAGKILMPDGNSITMWSYAPSGRPFQYPGPALCVTAGQTVTVTLRNQLPVPTSLMLPGVEGVLADGVPAAPTVGTDPGATIASLVQAAAPGGSVTYEFTAPPPGTYLYESGTDPELQQQMGLVGALVVRPEGYAPTAPTAYGSALSAHEPDQEYLHLLSEVDPDLHLAVELGDPVDLTTYHPRYWLINGRSFPDTIAPNHADWLPAQPYGALVQVQPIGQGQTLPSLIRYVNAGPRHYPFHPHSNHEKVIGVDARPLLGPDGEDLSYDAFAIDPQPGQTIDALFAWSHRAGSNPAGWGTGPGQEPALVPQPDPRNLMDGPYWNGSPYLGGDGVRPLGAADFNECGEFYHVAHNHALDEATTYGAAMGGQLTLVRVDPPGCN
jgi:FtsP/CotA-like multicopper oxidase with cupredoxin domain